MCSYLWLEKYALRRIKRVFLVRYKVLIHYSLELRLRIRSLLHTFGGTYPLIEVQNYGAFYSLHISFHAIWRLGIENVSFVPCLEYLLLSFTSFLVSSSSDAFNSYRKNFLSLFILPPPNSVPSRLLFYGCHITHLLLVFSVPMSLDPFLSFFSSFATNPSFSSSRILGL